MVKVIFNLLLSLAMITLGIGLVLSGLHAMPRVVSDREARADANAMAVPSLEAQLVGYGTDKDTYSRGDTANGYITLKNTGSTAINDVTLSVSVARSVPLLGTMSLGSKDFKVKGLNIRPGEAKKAEFSVDIPKEYRGFSTAGDYDVNGNVLVGGKPVGSFSKRIKVM
ncbi:MAG TPA: hypothetical protein VMC61_04310 [Methanocella sp.]|nr:hypothetical protein [Methanocella sp.]